MSPKRVNIISKRSVFKRFIFNIEEVRLIHQQYDGTMSDEITRLNLDRGDAVAAVVHEINSDYLLFTEQFRYSTYEKGPGWILEIPAGIVKRNETHEESLIREIQEEIGFHVKKIHHIDSFYLSPGGTSEEIILYYSSVIQGDKVDKGGGLSREGEDIKTVSLPINEVERMMKEKEFRDAKTIIGVQWFLNNREKLNQFQS